jgi:hypothetical protein
MPAPSESTISEVSGCFWKCVSQMRGGFAFRSGPSPSRLLALPLVALRPGAGLGAFLSTSRSMPMSGQPLKRQAARPMGIPNSTRIDHASKPPRFAFPRLPDSPGSPGPLRFARPPNSPGDCSGGSSFLRDRGTPSPAHHVCNSQSPSQFLIRIRIRIQIQIRTRI